MFVAREFFVKAKAKGLVFALVSRCQNVGGGGKVTREMRAFAAVTFSLMLFFFPLLSDSLRTGDGGAGSHPDGSASALVGRRGSFNSWGSAASTGVVEERWLNSMELGAGL